MKYAALAVLLALVVAAALFLRTDRGLGAKRITFAMYKWIIYDGLYSQAAAEFQAKWNREHPDDPIEVRYDAIGEDAYSQKISAEIVAGTVQDIFFPGDYHELVRFGALLDLTPYIEKYHAQAQIDKLYPQLLKAHTSQRPPVRPADQPQHRRALLQPHAVRPREDAVSDGGLDLERPARGGAAADEARRRKAGWCSPA